MPVVDKFKDFCIGGLRHGRNKLTENKVLVFNYSGVPIAKLILDKRIYQMALCTKLHKIIGLGNLPEPAFVSFDVVF